jgi:hypothetical protein
LGPFYILIGLPDGAWDFARVRVGDLVGLTLLPRSGAATAGGLLQAVAAAVRSQDADVVWEPVEQRPGETLGGKRLGPLLASRNIPRKSVSGS